MRATLAHVETALEGREAQLHDSWQALRLQAAELQSDVELTSELLQPDVSARVGPPPHAPPVFPAPPSPLLLNPFPAPKFTFTICCKLAQVQPDAKLDPGMLQLRCFLSGGPHANTPPSSPHSRPLCQYWHSYPSTQLAFGLVQSAGK